MIGNYLKIAWRNICKYRGYSFINIAGLAIGITVCLLILLFVRFELSYDTYHEHANSIFRLERQYLQSDGSVRGSFCALAPSFTPFLEKEFPEMEHIARIWDGGNTLISHGDVSFNEDRLFYAEHDIFEILSLPLFQGDPEKALAEPNSLVISRSMARKYFPDEDPMGLQVKVAGDFLFQITGVLEDPPENSHVHFHLLASYVSLQNLFGERGRSYFLGTKNFSDNVTHTYMRLAEGVDPQAISARIPEFIDKHLGTRRDADGNIIQASKGTGIFLRKVPDIHLRSHTMGELEANSDFRYVMIFSLVAVFILVIACINFMNLSTARAAKRAREVGLRKVVGASRGLLTGQFLGESLLISLTATLLGTLMVVIVLPFFRNFADRPLELSFLFNPIGLIMLAGVFLFTGFAAGIYPALYLSAFRPSSILRGELTRGQRGVLMRKALVVFQFTVSIALIVCVSQIYRQMHYIRNTDLGFQRENIVLISSNNRVTEKWQEIKQSLLESPDILAATMSKRAPSGRLQDSPGFNITINDQVFRSSFQMPHNRVEFDFFKTYGIEIIAGRDFSIEYPTDKQEAFIINQTAVGKLGLADPQEAVGLPMAVLGRKGRIIGVAEDFNYESLHNEIKAIVTYIRPQECTTVSLRTAPGGIPQALLHAESVWARLVPEYTFQYDFLDERLGSLYRNEERMMSMFGYFSILAVVIACLGLFGLASFTAEQRTKEIGIRKILGASMGNIVLLFSRDFTKWVLAANLLAWPTAYLVMDRWLKNFAYRTPISWPVFILAAVLTFLIALLTVSFQSLKTAASDPSKALRYE